MNDNTEPDLSKLPPLLPCPFCGSSVELERTSRSFNMIYGDRSWYGVVCRGTRNLGFTCAIQQRPSATPEAAIERWNMRTPLKDESKTS